MKPQCSMMQDDCRAAKKRQGAVMCEALTDTNFGLRACPFYKPVWVYERELYLIANGTAGYTPIVIDKERAIE